MKQSSTIRLNNCLNIGDLQALAARRLPRPLFDYLDGGAEAEVTLGRNTRAFDDLALIPRCLVDVESVQTSTEVLGQKMEWPLICAPTGGSCSFHKDGEIGVARAAAKAGIYYSLSTLATTSLEDVAAATVGPKMFQLYIFKDRDLTRDLIKRCRAAGYNAICLTVDASVRGNRERELRAGMGLTPKFTIGNILAFGSRPHWLVDFARTGSLSLPNIGQPGMSALNRAAASRFIGAQLNPSVQWKDVQEMIELWGGPFAIKGILSADDARRCVDIGATAVMVSNHGGRQLDGAPGAIEMLPEVVEAVGDQIEVILDGGIRRGAQILKALALGAKACAIGRPYLYGLSAGGQPGVARALEILRSELIRAMQLSGCSDVQSLDTSAVRRTQPNIFQPTGA